MSVRPSLENAHVSVRSRRCGSETSNSLTVSDLLFYPWQLKWMICNSVLWLLQSHTLYLDFLSCLVVWPILQHQTVSQEEGIVPLVFKFPNFVISCQRAFLLQTCHAVSSEAMRTFGAESLRACLFFSTYNLTFKLPIVRIECGTLGAPSGLLFGISKFADVMWMLLSGKRRYCEIVWLPYFIISSFDLPSRVSHPSSPMMQTAISPCLAQLCQRPLPCLPDPAIDSRPPESCQGCCCQPCSQGLLHEGLLVVLSTR